MKRRSSPKFDDCLTCRFFNPAANNPTCKMCGAGEFYTERITTRRPTDHQLMQDYKDFFDE